MQDSGCLRCISLKRCVTHFELFVSVFIHENFTGATSTSFSFGSIAYRVIFDFKSLYFSLIFLYRVAKKWHKFSPDSDREIILKIGWYLIKLRRSKNCAIFGPPCISCVWYCDSIVNFNHRRHRHHQQHPSRCHVTKQSTAGWCLWRNVQEMKWTFILRVL